MTQGSVFMLKGMVAMKFKNNALLLMGETAAFGWFILRGISFVAILPLPFLGWLYYKGMKRLSVAPIALNGITLLFSLFIGSELLSQGLFQGEGKAALLLLIPAVGLLAEGICKKELLRLSRWWAIAFAAVFLLMMLGGLPEIRLQRSLPPIGHWWEILLFYLLAFLEPFSLGRSYDSAPISLSLFLIPFGIVAWLTLGTGAFSAAEYPYLSVWSGVAFLSVRHIEGIILGFFYGAIALRCAEFFVNFRQNRCIGKENMVE